MKEPSQKKRKLPPALSAAEKKKAPKTTGKGPGRKAAAPAQRLEKRRCDAVDGPVDDALTPQVKTRKARLAPGQGTLDKFMLRNPVGAAG